MERIIVTAINMFGIARNRMRVQVVQDHDIADPGPQKLGREFASICEVAGRLNAPAKFQEAGRALDIRLNVVGFRIQNARIKRARVLVRNWK